MKTATVSHAESILYKLLDEAASPREPIQITGKRHNAILVLEDD